MRVKEVFPNSTVVEFEGDPVRVNGKTVVFSTPDGVREVFRPRLDPVSAAEVTAVKIRSHHAILT